jgi:hypothetical protein
VFVRPNYAALGRLLTDVLVQIDNLSSSSGIPSDQTETVWPRSSGVSPNGRQRVSTPVSRLIPWEVALFRYADGNASDHL